MAACVLPTLRQRSYLQSTTMVDFVALSRFPSGFYGCIRHK
jgi:hypothetical protein